MAQARRRRTQEERTAETRAKLMEATLDILLERGYARASTLDIADRAGVSRGALTHHFDSKDDLVCQSVEHMLRDATAEIRDYAERVQSGRIQLGSFIDHLWSMFSGRLFYVTLEHVTEARHNDFLRERLVPVVREFHLALDRIWSDFFRGTDLKSEEVATAFNACLCLLRGMGVQTVLRSDPAYYERLLDFWKRIVTGLADGAGRPAAVVKLHGRERAGAPKA